MSVFVLRGLTFAADGEIALEMALFVRATGTALSGSAPAADSAFAVPGLVASVAACSMATAAGATASVGAIGLDDAGWVGGALGARGGAAISLVGRTPLS